MWIVNTNSFVSIVEHWDSDDFVIVRGRRKSDVENFCAGFDISIIHSYGSDYEYRTIIDKEMLKEILKAKVDTLDYFNFKQNIDKSDLDLNHFAHEVWLSGIRNFE